MFEIMPGILEKEWTAIERKIELVRPFAKSIHIDIIDGKFADTVTFLDPAPFRKYTNDFVFELHMMVEEPLSYVDAWAAVGFRRFVAHIEHLQDQEAFVAKAQQLGEVGLALDSETPIDRLSVSPLDLDTVLIMTIQAGASGQIFQENQLEKIRALSEKDPLLAITVDGGIHEDTITKAYTSGARRFITTSEIFWSENPKERFVALQKSIEASIR